MIFTNELNKDSIYNLGNDQTLSSNSAGSDNNDGEAEFEVTPEMLVHGEDNEATLEEEEAFNDVDHASEIAELQKESELPIEDIFAMYYPRASEVEDVPHNTAASSEHKGMTLAQDERDNQQGMLANNRKQIQNEQVRRLQESIVAQGDISSTDEYNGDKNGDEFDPFFNQRITRGLAALNSQYFEEEYSTDEEYQPTADDWKKEIQIGKEFQAEVPNGISHYKPGERDDEGDKLLWRPDIVTPLQLKRFLSIAYKLTDMNSQTPERDDEQVLYTLLQTRDVDRALRRRHEQEHQRPDVSLWSEEECQNFEQGLRVFGKDFRLIQRNKVKSRTVGEIVQFYYLWKKTERHDAFVMQTKFGRKKYSLPGIADMMGRFMEETESVFSSRSTSPNFEQLGHPMASTNNDSPAKQDGVTNRDNNYPIYNNSNESYFGNAFHVNYNKENGNNTAWRTSPVTVVSTN